MAPCRLLLLVVATCAVLAAVAGMGDGQRRFVDDFLRRTRGTAWLSHLCLPARRTRT